VPPQYTDHAEQIIEKGTNLRVKLIGLRNDVRNMFAIGSIKEDYLGYDNFPEPGVMRVKLTGLTKLLELSEAKIKTPLRGSPDHTPASPGVMQLPITLACTPPLRALQTRSLLLLRRQGGSRRTKTTRLWSDGYGGILSATVESTGMALDRRLI
jgi:hypothetical protein